LQAITATLNDIHNAMSTLFPIEPQFPEGFQYVPNFISKAEEAYLHKEVLNVERHTFVFQGYEAKRKVASFGHDWSFEKQQLLKGSAIPQAFTPLLEKVAQHLHLHRDAFAELLVTEYPVGSVINWHRDAPPFDLIAGISLHTDCTFRLRPYNKERRDKNAILSFSVKRRSLYIMQGSVRTHWQHSIAAVPHVRYSITLRTLRNPLQP
jgi:alkylated DNA repair dioxygenase AlkB